MTDISAISLSDQEAAEQVEATPSASAVELVREAINEAIDAVLARERGGTGFDRHDLPTTQALLRHIALAEAMGAVVEGWKDESTAPEYKRLVTYRMGEEDVATAMLRIWPDGDREWMASDGRTTVTHHSYAPPTHWLCEVDMLPGSPKPSDVLRSHPQPKSELPFAAAAPRPASSTQAEGGGK